MIEYIKEGFNLTHKNWQLILIQIAIMVIIFIGFIIFVGIPLAIAFVFFGVDLTHVRDFLNIFKNPMEFLSKYLGLAILIITTFFIYLCFASVLSMFAFGGTLGVLRNSSIDMEYKFSLHSFLQEGKKLFLPIFWFASIILIIFIAVSFFLGIVAGTGFSVVNAYEEGTFPALFIAYFIALLLLLSGIVITLLVLTITAYAVIILTVDKTGILDAFRKSFNFVKHNPKAILFYVLLIFGYASINLTMILLNYPFTLIPFIGFVINIPYQIMSYIVLNYLVIVMAGDLIIFYIKTMQYPVHTGAYEI